MKKRNTIQAIIFDFDGTLASLTIDFPKMKRSISAIASALLEREVSLGDTPALEWLDSLADDACSTDDTDIILEIQSRARLTITAMELDAAREGVLFPFTRPLLKGLNSNGTKVGIITRNCTPAVKTVFPDIEDYCSVFLAREDVPNVKPHPDHLLMAAQQMTVHPGNILMVGDHPLDIETARNAGAMSAAVYSGKMTAEDLAAHDPDFLAKDCEALFEEVLKCGVCC